jgi:mono/diheme cytochrome c family protein
MKIAPRSRRNMNMKTMFRRLSVVCLVPALAMAAVLAWSGAFAAPSMHAAGAQNTAGPKIWDGVYTAAQAERGRAAFTASCVLCHKDDLSGGQGPALTGELFMINWQGETLNRFFAKVRDTMPPNFGLLESKTKLDIVAYILSVNGFPAGAAELTENPDELDGIQILKKGALGGIPNFSLVEIVGCLTPGPNNTWLLTNTTEPVATREESTTPAGLTEAAARPAGVETYVLSNVTPGFGAPAHPGHKMQARGLLYRDGTARRLNLTSLQMLAPTCPN